jgi:hypothetical protein
MFCFTPKVAVANLYFKVIKPHAGNYEQGGQSSIAPEEAESSFSLADIWANERFFARPQGFENTALTLPKYRLHLISLSSLSRKNKLSAAMPIGPLKRVGP